MHRIAELVHLQHSYWTIERREREVCQSRYCEPTSGTSLPDVELTIKVGTPPSPPSNSQEVIGQPDASTVA
jgi:hypothetical protein